MIYICQRQDGVVHIRVLIHQLAAGGCQVCDQELGLLNSSEIRRIADKYEIKEDLVSICEKASTDFDLFLYIKGFITSNNYLLSDNIPENVYIIQRNFIGYIRKLHPHLGGVCEALMIKSHPPQPDIPQPRPRKVHPNLVPILEMKVRTPVKMVDEQRVPNAPRPRRRRRRMVGPAARRLFN